MTPEDLERAGWDALSTSDDAARSFYADVLADDVTFLFPDGTLLRGRDAALASFGVAPWASWSMSEVGTQPLGDAGAVVTYRAEAQRAGDAPYRALVSSVYRRDGERWVLCAHQQTTVPD